MENIILKCSVKEYDGKELSVFIWLRIETGV
jgi:hypothetical protein